MSQITTHNPIPTLARIKVPTLWLWGEKDDVIPIGDVSGFISGFPGAILVRLPHLGHATFVNDPVASLKPAQRFRSGATK